MTRHVSRFASATLALGLVIGGVTGGSALLATAAPGDPLAGGFVGTPDADDFLPTGAKYEIHNLDAETGYTLDVDVEFPDDPGVWATALNNQPFTTDVDGSAAMDITLYTTPGVVPLPVGSNVRVTVDTPLLIPTTFVTTYTIPAASIPPTAPTGAFVGSPTADELFAGTELLINNLLSTDDFMVNTYIADVTDPTNFVLFDSSTHAVGDATTGTAFSALISAHHTSPDTALDEGDIVRVRISVQSNPEVNLVDYVVPAAPVAPAPAGSFDVVVPTPDNLLDGTLFSLSNLDSSVTNTLIVLVKSGSDTNFAVQYSHNIAPGDITAGNASVLVTAHQNGDTAIPLADGDEVQLALAVNGASPVTLVTYAVSSAPVATTPTGAFNPANPTAQDIMDGASYVITGLNGIAAATVTLYLKGEDETDFSLLETFDIDPVVNNAATIMVEAYYTDGTTSVALSPCDVVRVAITPEGETEVVLTDYIIPGECTPVDSGVNPTDTNKGNLAKTGENDGNIISTLLLGFGGILSLGLILGATYALRRKVATV